MVSNEFPDTRRVVEAHLLPLFREHRVRYLQSARNGHTLGEELTAAGTCPQVASLRCSIKLKGWVIDTWLRQELGGHHEQSRGNSNWKK